MIQFKSKGSFDKSIRFLWFLYDRKFLRNLNSYAQAGVNALAAYTPVDTGETSNSWDYSIKTTPNKIVIYFTNSKLAGNTPVAILLQYGHATKDGYYVQGVDYINPALEPIFNKIANDIWREVVNA